MNQPTASGFTMLLLSLLACACGSAHRKVTADEFTQLMQQPPASMSSVSFLGTDGDRAYLTHWRMGLLFGDTTDVCSVAIDDLPAAERDALRDGRNPWLDLRGTNDPGMRAEERDALLATMRAPPNAPIVVVLRCTKDRAASVARNHFDDTFTDDDSIPIPAPCDVIVVATADEPATVRLGDRELLHLQPARTAAAWRHVHAPGTVALTVQGASTWQVELRAAPATDFYTAGFDQSRSKR